MKQPSHDTVAIHPPRPYLLPTLERPRRTLSPRIGYAVAALVVGLSLFASVTPSPHTAKARIEAGPTSFASKPGKMKMPEPIMALMPMQNVSKIEIRRALGADEVMFGCKVGRA